MIRSIALAIICFATLHAQGASIAGLRFVGNHFDVISIDSETGEQITLVENAFQDLWGGSFVTDRENDIGYVTTSSMELFRYRLSTGKVLASPTLDFGGALALGKNGNLVGVHFVKESGGGFHCNIDTINSKTGASQTLVPNAFKDLWGGSFISNPALGVGYVITESKKLLQFDLGTGAKIASPQLSFGGPLALAPGGKLVGVRKNTSGGCDIVSIEPSTGSTSTLISGAFGDFWFGTFSSDLDSGIGYVLTSDNQLFQFSLVTGERLNAPPVAGAVRYARFATKSRIGARLSAARLIYTGRKSLFTHKPAMTFKGKAGGNVHVVRYRVGLTGAFLKAKGTTSWTFQARLKKGVNHIAVRADGPGGNSKITFISVIRD